MKAFPFILLFVFLLTTPYSPFCLHPSPQNSRFLIKHWGDGSGLPQSSVNSMVQTQDGYIWMATYGGLARFDGLNFKIFDVGNTPALKSNRFLRLYEDRQGSLWIFPEAAWGVLRFKDNQITTFDTSSGLPSNRVESVLVARSGDIWFGTDKGVCRMTPKGCQTYSTANGLDHNSIFYLFEDSTGKVWIGTDTGVNLWDKSKIDSLKATLPLPEKRIFMITETEKGKILVANSTQVFEISHNKMKRILSLEEGGYTSHVLRDKQGGFWFAMEEGLKYCHDGQLEIFNHKNGLSGDNVRCTLIDREGNVWLGMEGAGLHRLKRSNINTFWSNQGLPKQSIVPICGDGAGGVWIGGNGEGLFHFDPDTGQTRNWQEKEGLSRSIWSLLLDRNGSLWVGTWGDGLFRLNRRRQISLHLSDELVSSVIPALYQDQDGSIWIGTEKGLHRYRDGHIDIFTTRQGLVDNNIKYITQDRSGALWIGTTGGMSRMENGSFTNYTTTNGLGNSYVRAIYEDRDGTLWIGTYGGGLHRLKDNNFFQFNRSNGLYDNVVSRIMEDNEKNFWMTCNHGIYRVSRLELNDFAEGRKPIYTCYHYGVEDGMISSECNGGGQPAGWRSKDDKLWFPTIKGVVRIDPAKRNPIPPTVAIERILLDGKPLDLEDKVILPPGRKRLEFFYTGISFTAAEKVRFRFLLDGFDSGWTEAGTSRTASYTNLPYGRYTFRLRAANNEGIWSERDATLSLEVKPFFYQTTWFLALCVILAAGIVFGVYEWRLSRIKARERELKVLVKERTKELAAANIELEKLSIVASETINAVAIMDAQGNIEWVNEGFTRLYGYTLSELMTLRGTNLVEVSAHPEIKQIVARCVEEKRAEAYDALFETKDGGKLWTQTSLTPILNSQGQVSRLVTIDTDISKIKAAEEAAERANQSKSEFLARMSHEIRTPMNGVIGFTDMLLDTQLNDEQMDYARTINRSAEALITLLNDILDFSKIEAGELTFDPIDFDPEVTAFDICELISPRIQSKPVEIICRIGDSIPPFIKADPGRFRQVVVNLMGNAAKFTEEGEIELSLDAVEQTDTRLKLHVQVRDTGIGIAEEKLGLVFDVFQQADGSTTRKYGGTGLGLAICKQISQLMGGDVWVESQAGQGSTFHFTCWVDKSVKERPKELKPQFLSGKLAMIVDDHPANQEILSYSLKKVGMSVMALSDPKQVIPALEDQKRKGQPVDIAILDIQMPGYSGFDLAKEIRSKSGSLGKLPLLAFSSSTISRSKKFREAGFNGFLPKPIHQRKLLKMVARLLGKLEEEMVTQHIITEESKQSIHILLAEDNPINQKLALFMLQKAGYTVTVANDGEAAVEIFTSSPQTFDLILMDIQMPKLDGRQATQKIRRQGFEDIPIIAMTAEAMKGDEARCLAAGMNDYIPKPIKREKIFKIVKKWYIDR